jgi:molybdate transport system substrate-binding protein
LRRAEENVNRKIVKSILCSIILTAAIAALAAGWFTLFPRGSAAQTVKLHVMISDGLKTVVEELTPQIERSIGRKLAVQFNSSKNLRDKIQAGEQFDAAILTSDVLDDLIQKGKLAAATRADISRTGIGVGVRAGAAKPDISTADALKQAFLNAKSISFNPTGASAAPTFNIFASLGILDAVKPKLLLDAEAGRPQMNVAAGKADIVISLVPEIKFFPGVELVGPIPSDLQSYVSFAGAAAANTKDTDAGKALLQFLTGPTAVPVLKAKGMEPPSK